MRIQGRAGTPARGSSVVTFKVFWGETAAALRSLPASTDDPPPAPRIERGDVMSIFSHFQQRFESTRQEELSLQEYLELCKQDRSAYASAAERLLLAIGEPELVDTSTNSRLSRIFSNKVIRRYPAFADFHGMEECIDQIVSYFRHAAQGLEEKKQILYLLGPVGGGKSSLAEKLKQLIERVPFYAIKGSPVFESPLGLFNATEDGAILEEDFGIPRRYLSTIMSPWATKRLA
ncbi:Protein kinase, partial [Pseudomonas savastanoi pv. glycinea]